MSSPSPSSSLLLPLLSLLLLGTALLREARSERMSGLYVDNGLDQTVVHRVVTDREKRQVEHEILNLLGLPERPPKHASHASPQVKRSAPKFLLDIYKNALDGLSGQESKAIDQSDVIMTFAARSHHVPGVRHERGKRLWFDVSEAPANERVLNGELRLFRSADAAKNRKLGQAAFTLTVYRVLRLEDGERELQYVDAVNATGNGWVTLNVTEALAHWIEHPRDNRGVYLSVHPADRHVHEMKPEDIGIVGFKGQVDKQPFMVGFFKSSGAKRRPAAQVRALPSTRSKREAKSTKRRKTADFLGNLDWRFGNPYTDPQLQHNAKTCRIQTLYVSFKDLSWQDWIIAPEGFDAYYCSGECNFPLNAHMNATNHAIVQTLVHLVNPGKVPKPCCAPTKLTPISVLYFYDETNVILKKYKNMVVKSCGCH